jgi:hypothetical protein
VRDNSKRIPRGANVSEFARQLSLRGFHEQSAAFAKLYGVEVPTVALSAEGEEFLVDLTSRAQQASVSPSACLAALHRHCDELLKTHTQATLKAMWILSSTRSAVVSVDKFIDLLDSAQRRPYQLLYLEGLDPSHRTTSAARRLLHLWLDTYENKKEQGISTELLGESLMLLLKESFTESESLRLTALQAMSGSRSFAEGTSYILDLHSDKTMLLDWLRRTSNIQGVERLVETRSLGPSESRRVLECAIEIVLRLRLSTQAGEVADPAQCWRPVVDIARTLLLRKRLQPGQVNICLDVYMCNKL